MNFEIKWSIPAQAWEKVKASRQQEVPGSDYDTSRLPYYDHLNGVVQFSYQQELLFPAPPLPSPAGIGLSVLDLAAGLKKIMDKEGFEQAKEGAIATFYLSDDSLEIYFEKQAGKVVISSNFDDLVKLNVPETQFVREVNKFETDFVHEVVAKAPSILDWHSLAALRPKK